MNTPGRGQTPEKLHWMAALPRLRGRTDSEELAEGTATLVKAVQEAWEHPSAPQVRLLPRLLPASELPRGGAHGHGMAIGVSEDTLQPVFLDFDQEPFLLVFGEGESGKTATLRMLVRQICDRYRPEEARFLVGDYRRSLLGSVPEEYIGAYGTMAPKLMADMKAARGLMEGRLPPADITPQQLRTGRWWEGPLAFVIIDDFDLVATGSNHPLTQLVELLPYARDTGMRFIIARNSAGASRAMFDPFMQRLRELGAQGWCSPAIGPRAKCCQGSALAPSLPVAEPSSPARAGPGWSRWAGFRRNRRGGRRRLSVQDIERTAPWSYGMSPGRSGVSQPCRSADSVANATSSARCAARSSSVYVRSAASSVPATRAYRAVAMPSGHCAVPQARVAQLSSAAVPDGASASCHVTTERAASSA